MSQQQRPAPTRSPGGGGSVRRARERVEAGLPSKIPQPPRQRPYDAPRAAPSPPQNPTPPQTRSPPQNRSRPQMPPALAGSRNGQGPIGVAISRPTQVPQWPLSAPIENVPEPRGNDEQQYRAPGRGPPPQRPPRPSHVPSMLDASRLQEHTPAFQYRPPQNPPPRNPARMQSEEETTSPITPSSRPSTTSSVGTIPDFPVPLPVSAPQGPPRRSANLGPPPSSRRGASSYYSQISYVSPIPEESPRQPSHGSYASSAAMPPNWEPTSPDDAYDEDYNEAQRGFDNPTIEEGRESRESNGNDDEERGLIRSASLGKRAKPSMITTKSSDKVESQRAVPVPQQKSKLERMGVIDGGIVGATAAAMTASQMRNGQRETVWPMVGNDPTSPLAGGTGFIDQPSSSESVPTIANAMSTDEAVLAPVGDPNDPRAKAMLGAFNAASSLTPGPGPTRTPSPGFSRLSAIRRPPRLDMDAVRDAEARGSLTSLPDLIRRATRLAAMIDRGKRPASRLNDLNDFPSVSDLAKNDKELQDSSDEKYQSGISGMLAAFPPPGLATPTQDPSPRRLSTWPQPGYDPDSVEGKGGQQKPTRKRRRCCGLPCWGFLLLLLILLIIIAAAIVIPLELLVIHKPKSTSIVTTLALCKSDPITACQNGGTSTVTTNTCACICINGFTGSTCTNSTNVGCTTTAFNTTDSNLSNVTLGDSIPRLITAADANFSIPLFSTTILARFNSASLSCASENALVTFDGLSTRQGGADSIVTPSATTPSAAQKRDTADAATTTSGRSIVSDTSSLAAQSTTSSAAAASTSSPSDSSVFYITEQVLDFSRVAVLFVLQQQTLDNAVSAQSNLQHFFALQSFTNGAAKNVTLGDGNSVNLLNFSLMLDNTISGGTGNDNATAS